MRRKTKNSRTLKLLKKLKNCSYCGKQLGPCSATADHFMPRCMGGKRTKENIRLACKKCNGAKGSIPGDQWMKTLPVLLEAGYMEMSRKEKRAWRKGHPGMLEYPQVKS